MILTALAGSFSAALDSAFPAPSRRTKAYFDDPTLVLRETRSQAALRISNLVILLSIVLLACIALLLEPQRLTMAIILGFALLALVSAMSMRDRQRERIEEFLSESEERMTLAVEAAGLGLWRWDAGRNDFWMTSRCREIFGLSAEADYAAMTAAIHPDDRQTAQNAIGQAMLSQTSYEIRHRVMADGEVRWVRVQGRPIADAQGEMIHIAGTVLDITEQMMMQAEMEHQRQSLLHLTRVGTIGELSGALAHELNQPLTAILTNAQAIQRILSREPIDVDILRSAVADIIDDDARAGDVIRHLRTLLKKGEGRREPVDLEKMVHQVLALARNELAARHVFPVVRMSDMAPVLGDPVQLQQLLLNLILNASEAISGAELENGILIITASMVGGQLRLSIADTGPGLKPEVIARLFEPFFSTKKQGMGLGLSICRAIVESHGGSIEAECNSWDGATFHVSLPLAS